MTMFISKKVTLTLFGFLLLLPITNAGCKIKKFFGELFDIGRGETEANPFFKVKQYTVNELTDLFHFIDKDHDGYLSPEEIMAWFPKLSLDLAKKFVADGDQTGDNRLNIQEWVTLMTDLENRKKDPFVYQDMRNFIDVDGDGFVSKEEITRFLTKGGTENQALTEPMVKELMEKLDKNGDGKIDYEEFSEYIVTNPKLYKEQQLRKQSQHQ